MKSVYNCWGDYGHQTTGVTKEGQYYIQGYSPGGKLVKLAYEPNEWPELVEKTLNVQRRRGNL